MLTSENVPAVHSSDGDEPKILFLHINVGHNKSCLSGAAVTHFPAMLAALRVADILEQLQFSKHSAIDVKRVWVEERDFWGRARATHGRESIRGGNVT